MRGASARISRLRTTTYLHTHAHTVTQAIHRKPHQPILAFAARCHAWGRGAPHTLPGMSREPQRNPRQAVFGVPQGGSLDLLCLLSTSSQLQALQVVLASCWRRPNTPTPFRDLTPCPHTPFTYPSIPTSLPNPLQHIYTPSLPSPASACPLTPLPSTL